MPLVLIREDPVFHVWQPRGQVVTHTHRQTDQAVSHSERVDHRVVQTAHAKTLEKNANKSYRIPIDIQIDVLWVGVLDQFLGGGPVMTSNLSFNIRNSTHQTNKDVEYYIG